jgi:hypothetical protein
VYDNRAVYTERRPDVYLESEGLTGPTEIVCDFYYNVDGSSSCSPMHTAKDFGRIPEGSDRSDWLWADCRKAEGCSSRLLVICTPYYPGRHWAQSVGEFMPLVDQLEAFHAKNFVHGDIRATNTAFCESSNNCKSRLFDWDMGGKVIDPADASQSDAKSAEEGENPSSDTVIKYPEGFRSHLFDATRAGWAGMPITKVHDWVALTGLILNCHDLVPSPENRTSNNSTTDLFLRMRDLRAFPSGSAGDDVGKHVAELRAFLSEVENKKWEVTLDTEFRADLIEYGYLKEDNLRPTSLQQGSDDATGSPDKERTRY